MSSGLVPFKFESWYTCTKISRGGCDEIPGGCDEIPGGCDEIPGGCDGIPGGCKELPGREMGVEVAVGKRISLEFLFLFFSNDSLILLLLLLLLLWLLLLIFVQLKAESHDLGFRLFQFAS